MKVKSIPHQRSLIFKNPGLHRYTWIIGEPGVNALKWGSYISVYDEINVHLIPYYLMHFYNIYEGSEMLVTL